MATANMVKGWSTEVGQFAYTYMLTLLTLLQMREINNKRLKLATKVPTNLQTKKMRPISLY
jgi:hypothetical protein